MNKQPKALLCYISNATNEAKERKKEIKNFKSNIVTSRDVRGGNRGAG
jgi:hypothetical protein